MAAAAAQVLAVDVRGGEQGGAPGGKKAMSKSEIASILGTGSPGNAESMLGPFAGRVAVPRPIRKFGSVPVAKVPLTPEGALAKKDGKTNTRAHELALEGSADRFRTPDGRTGHEAAAVSPRTPGRGGPQEASAATPRRGNSTSVMAGFQHAKYASAAPSAASSPAASAEARRKPKDADPLIQLEPSSRIDREAQARRIYYARGPTKASTAAAPQPVPSSRFLESFKERTPYEAAQEEATTDLFQNLHPRLLLSMKKLATELNITLFPPKSHAKLNKSHLDAWKKSLRLGLDDRLYKKPNIEKGREREMNEERENKREQKKKKRDKLKKDARREINF